MTTHSHDATGAAWIADNHRTLIAASLWLRLGFVGLLVCVGAATTLAEGWPHDAFAAIAAISAGAWLAVFSWRKANAALLCLDAPAADLPPLTLRDRPAQVAA